MNSTKTINFFIVGLFAVAGLVITRVVIVINKTFSSAIAAKVTAPAKVDYGDSNDWDHDGLTNAEEAVWGTDPYNPDTDGDGFLDGEEVASGHDPLNPKDHDSLSTEKAFQGLNSTQRLSLALTGGILNGDLKRGTDPTKYAQSINTIAGSTVHTVLSALESVQVGEDEFKIGIDNSKEAQEKYVGLIYQAISGDVMNIIFGQSTEAINLFLVNQTAPNGQLFDAQQKEDIKTKFLQHAVKFQQAFDQLKLDPIPPDWVDVHKKALTLLKKLELYYRDIALNSEDSLRQTIVLGNLQNVYLQSQPILTEIDNLIKKNNLHAPHSDFFQVNNLLTK